MPHICLRCQNRLEAAPGLAPRCPICGGTRFAYESPRKVKTGEQITEQEISDPESGDINAEERIVEPKAPEPKNPSSPTGNPDKDSSPLSPESVESIRILEPGKYHLNLHKLAESDDRVVQIGKDGNYRLDLNSMNRPRKKNSRNRDY